jgi:hypothetical protein
LAIIWKVNSTKPQQHDRKKDFHPSFPSYPEVFNWCCAAVEPAGRRNYQDLLALTAGGG